MKNAKIKKDDLTPKQREFIGKGGLVILSELNIL